MNDVDELITTRVLGAVERAAAGYQWAATALVRLGTTLVFSVPLLNILLGDQCPSSVSTGCALTAVGAALVVRLWWLPRTLGQLDVELAEVNAVAVLMGGQPVGRPEPGQPSPAVLAAACALGVFTAAAPHLALCSGELCCSTTAVATCIFTAAYGTLVGCAGGELRGSAVAEVMLMNFLRR